MSDTDKRHILLIGPPNSGKTSLFNWLTGFKRKTVNYPGSTALLSSGPLLPKYGLEGYAEDSPGLYSLFSPSEEGRESQKALFKNNVSDVVLVLDASKLEIQLPLLFQLKEAGFSPILALTMTDLAPKRSLINISALEEKLGAPAVIIQGLMGGGVEELIKKIKASPRKAKSLPQKIEPWSEAKFSAALNQSKKIVRQAFLEKEDPVGEKENPFYSHKWDRLFLHPKKGIVLFALIMFGLFSSIFWMAEPFMSAIDKAFSFLIQQSSQRLSAWPELADFVSHGLLASFGSVLLFVPQIFILFAGISLLEDTGYLARAAALMDGPLSKIGLSGKAFFPFLSGYACAIPAVLLSRSLSSKRERWMAFFAIPFMTCSARLPVYALLLSFLFYGQSAWKPGLALSAIYLSSFFLGILAVSLLNRFLKKEPREPFLMDLPLYRRPFFLKALRSAGQRTKHYIVKAGPAIFVVALAIWLLSHFPARPDLPPSERLQQSYAGQIGRTAEPVFEAMGMDWRAGTALISAFAAREVFVPALVLAFSAAPAEGEGLGHSLLETMRSASWPDGALIFTKASVFALVIFFMLSLQCLSTTAIVYKESGSFRLALGQFLALNILAWLMAVLTFQSLSLIL